MLLCVKQAVLLTLSYECVQGDNCGCLIGGQFSSAHTADAGHNQITVNTKNTVDICQEGFYKSGEEQDKHNGEKHSFFIGRTCPQNIDCEIKEQQEETEKAQKTCLYQDVGESNLKGCIPTDNLTQGIGITDRWVFPKGFRIAEQQMELIVNGMFPVTDQTVISKLIVGAC